MSFTPRSVTFSGNSAGTSSRVLQSLTASWAVTASRAKYSEDAGGAATSWVTNNSGNLASVTSSLMTWSSSVKTEISGLNTWSASAKNQISAIETATSSLNTWSSSAKTSITNLNTATQSLNSKSGSWDMTATWVENNSGNINTATGSAKAVSALTASLVASASVAKNALNWISNNSGAIDSTTGSSHTHSNKGLLDSLTNAKTGSWDSKWNYNEATIKAVKVTSASRADSAASADSATSASRAVSASRADSTPYSHTHGNKAILDTWTSQELVSLPSSSTGATTGQVELPSGKYVVCGELTGDVTFKLGASVGNGRQDIYSCQFKMGSTLRNVSMPSGITWVEGTPDFSKPNSTYEFSIVASLGVLVRS